MNKNNALNPQNNFAVLIVSCDKYSDLWEPFFRCFKKFWPDCPFNIYFLSNHLSTATPNVKNILIGKDISWSSNLKKGLRKIKEEYILLFLEDLFLYDYVRTDKILEIFNYIFKLKPNYVKMNYYLETIFSSRPDKFFNQLFGIFSKGVIYRVSTVLSVWKVDFLLNLLKEDESAWEFEIYGSNRSDAYDGFYGVWKNYFSVMNGVIKGKWRIGAVRKLKSLGININIETRKVMAIKEAIIFWFEKQRSKIFNIFVPNKYKRKVRFFFKKKAY